MYKIKPEKYKARIVVRGDQQDLDDKVATYSPTLKSITLWLLLALASYLGWSLWQMDVCNAFLNAPLPDDTPVFMYSPKGYERPGQAIRLRKALYGLKQSPRQWFDTLKLFLCSPPLSLTQCPVDACLFLLVVKGVVVLLVGNRLEEHRCNVCPAVGIEVSACYLAEGAMFEKSGRQANRKDWAPHGQIGRNDNKFNQKMHLEIQGLPLLCCLCCFRCSVVHLGLYCRIA